jgi:hypothetical protein
MYVGGSVREPTVPSHQISCLIGRCLSFLRRAAVAHAVLVPDPVPIFISDSLVSVVWQDKSQRDDSFAMSRLILLRLREETRLPFCDCMRFFTFGNYKGTPKVLYYCGPVK